MDKRITKKSDRVFKDNDKLITSLFRTATRCDYKRSWVTFEFMRLAYKPTLKQFKRIAFQLGYADGWADITFNEYYN